jgi:hypothetical protein
VTDAQTTVLLGAGASAPAGLPISAEVTEQVAQIIAASHRYRAVGQALNLAIGAMVAHDTARGRSAYAGIDIERLFSAVEMLSARDDLEIAPFVSSWVSGLQQIGAGTFPSFWAKNFKKALLESRFESDVERQFAEAVRSLTGAGSGQSAFKELRRTVLDALQDVLTVDESKVDYLAPIFRLARPAHIATLNYDLSVELAAQRAGVALDTGAAAWRGGNDWAWQESTDVRLLKLHGSMNWHLASTTPEGKLREATLQVSDEPQGRLGYQDAHGIVFGQRGKLQSEGPFLAMLREFDRILASTDRLVVVGYSLRDDHINTSIRRWFNSREVPKVVLIDREFPSRWQDRERTFLHDLVRAMTTTGPNPELREGNLMLTSGAADGLREVFGAD